MNNSTGKWLMIVAIVLLMTSFILFGEPARQLLTTGSLTLGSAADVKLTGWFFSIGVISLIAGAVAVSVANKN